MAHYPGLNFSLGGYNFKLQWIWGALFLSVRKIISDFRSILVREYFQVGTDIVWTVVERELRNLKVSMTKILNQLA